MKKFYTFAALAAAAISASAQAIDIDNLTDTQIEGKYRVVSPMNTYIDDVYVDEEPLVIFTKTAENTFDVNEFILPVQDYDYNTICIGATWEPATEDGNANLNVQRDVNGEAYFYNTYYDYDDHYWIYLWNQNFRLLPSLTEEGTLQFGRAEGANPIVFQYYDSETGEWTDAFGWYNGFTLVKEPVYTTVTKRSLAGTYTLTGWDYDNNALAYEVTITQDGTNYLLSGLFGADDVVLTCTWDNNGGGIRAAASFEYDELGYTIGGVGSDAPSSTIYFSFDENGRLVADFPIYGAVGDGWEYIFDAVLTKGKIDGLSQLETPARPARSYDLQGRNLTNGRAAHAPLLIRDGRVRLNK